MAISEAVVGRPQRRGAWFYSSDSGYRFARLAFLLWDEWRTTVTERQASATWDHIAHSPNCSIAKARERLNYAPRYTSLEAVIEAVETLI